MIATVLLADDHVIMLEGLRVLLALDPDFKVIGEARDGHDAVAMARSMHPDVVVMDIGMPGLNGIEATRQILSENPEIKVVALSTYAETQFVLAMLEAGASGYVVKSAASDDLLRALRAVMANKKYLAAAVSSPAVEAYMTRLARGAKTPSGVLSPREREVLQLLAEGKTSREIGVMLGNAESTVEVHRRNIMMKLNVNSIAQLTKYAVKTGLTSL